MLLFKILQYIEKSLNHLKLSQKISIHTVIKKINIVHDEKTHSLISLINNAH